MSTEHFYLDDIESEDLYEDYFEDDDDDEAYYSEEDDDDDEAYYSEEDDDDDEAYFEDDDDDDEAYGEDAAERRRRRRRRRRRKRYRRPRVARGRGYRRKVRPVYRGKGRIKTPAGTARVKLPPNLATKQDVKRALGAVSRDIKRNAKAIKVTNSNIKRLDSSVSSVNRRQSGKIKKLDKSLDGFKQQQLFNVLLGPPKIEKLEMKGQDVVLVDGEDGTKIPELQEVTKTYEVTSVERDNSTAMLMAMMSGMGGSGGDNNMLMPLVLMQAMDKDDGKNDDNTMLLVMMMMMNQK